MSQPWTIVKWHHYDRYQCAECPFSTLKPDAIAKHYADHHGPIVRKSNLVDPNGAPIVTLEERPPALPTALEDADELELDDLEPDALDS